MLLGSETLFKVFVLQDVFHSALDLGRKHFKLANSDSGPSATDQFTLTHLRTNDRSQETCSLLSSAQSAQSYLSLGIVDSGDLVFQR